jgi:hypothetical protein
MRCGPAALGDGGDQEEIRLELVYIPSPYKEEAVNFSVSIGGQ